MYLKHRLYSHSGAPWEGQHRSTATVEHRGRADIDAHPQWQGWH